MANTEHEVLEIAGHEVSVSNPRKLYFPKAGITKLELVEYYLAVQPGDLKNVPANQHPPPEDPDPKTEYEGESRE